MNHDDLDEQDDLWQLLGKAKQPQVSPFFSRNVLRTIREEQPERGVSWLVWLRRHLGAASIGAVAVFVALFACLPTAQNHDAEFGIEQAAQEVVASPDFTVIENLDSLLAWQDNDVWLDSSVR